MKKPIETEYRDVRAMTADGSWLEILQKVVVGPDNLLDRTVTMKISKEQFERMVSKGLIRTEVPYK